MQGTTVVGSGSLFSQKRPLRACWRMSLSLIACVRVSRANRRKRNFLIGRLLINYKRSTIQMLQSWPALTEDIKRFGWFGVLGQLCSCTAMLRNLLGDYFIFMAYKIQTKSNSFYTKHASFVEVVSKPKSGLCLAHIQKRGQPCFPILQDSDNAKLFHKPYVIALLRDMQTVRKIMRGIGRVAVSLLLFTFFIAAYNSQSVLIKHYTSKYDPFRFLLYANRIVNLPPGKYIEGLFQYFYFVDLGYGLLCGLLILWGKRLGGWMMAVWYLSKLAIYYLPHLFRTPRQPFKLSDRYEMMRQIALLGVALALSCRPPTDNSQSDVGQEKEGLKEGESVQPNVNEVKEELIAGEAASSKND